MIEFILKPPGLYIFIAVVLILGSFTYWKRDWIKKNFRIKEIGLGPVTVEAREKDKTKSQIDQGVSFGENNEFGQATIKDVVGGSRLPQSSTSKTKSSVAFGSENVFTGAEIEDITGGDVVEDKKTDT